MTEPFDGAKIALIHRESVLTILRDDLPGLAWRGFWDLPGGGREGGETPADCARRETREELGIVLPPEAIRPVSRHQIRGRLFWFLSADLPDFDPARVRFGDEGQCWRLVPVHRFLGMRAIPGLQDRLARYLAGGRVSRHAAKFQHKSLK